MFRSIFVRLGVLVFGLAILFLSLTRAGLELMAQGDNAALQKIVEIKFIYTDDNGEKVSAVYKLPEVNLLPDNPVYGFKRIRDWFWLTFSRGENRLKLTTLMADKKMVEFGRLSEKDKNGAAIEAGNEAMDKLEYADSQIKVLGAGGESLRWRRQLIMAGYAYAEMARRQEEKYKLDGDKYQVFVKRIDEWIKEKEKEKYKWNI